MKKNNYFPPSFEETELLSETDLLTVSNPEGDLNNYSYEDLGTV